MKRVGLLIFVLSLAWAHGLSLSKASNARISYEGYSVYKIPLKNESQLAIFERLAEDLKNFNIWHSSGSEVHLMVSPKQHEYLQLIINAMGLKADLMVTDVQELMCEEQAPEGRSTEAFGWTQYHVLEDIYAWLDGILETYPTVTEGFVVGQSYEGRDIRGIKISYKAGNPGIFIESNIHAREWITSATATWFINELLSSTDTNVRQLAESFDWWIVPVFNVDGFVYTHKTDRMWRKTRQPWTTSDCIGADPNRNWNSHWMENGGASANPCSTSYAGPEPFSEREVKALSDFILSIKDRVNILFAFHSYSQLLLSPYGHTAEEYPPNYPDLMRAAEAYAVAVKNMVYGTEYEYGSSAGILYTASGTTNDWAYNEAGVQLSYTIEFRDTGRYGFVLPPVNIIPNCQETMTGIQAFVKEAEAMGYLQLKYTV